jgi:hypothetical protein
VRDEEAKRKEHVIEGMNLDSTCLISWKNMSRHMAVSWMFLSIRDSHMERDEDVTNAGLVT